MAAALLSDPLWELVEPFLPTPNSQPRGGRPRISDRACLTGILFVLRTGVPWQLLPRELGCGSGMTCWRRLRDWQLAGVWDLIHFALLDWLARKDRIDWSRAVVDSCSIRAVYGGDQTVWAGGGGSWSAPFPGSTSSGACASVTTSAPTSTKRSSRSVAR